MFTKYNLCKCVPLKGTQSSSCLPEHLSPQLGTASTSQIHQSYIFCNKHHLANTVKLGKAHSVPMTVFAVNFKRITGILEIFLSLSDTSPRLSQWCCWFTSSRIWQCFVWWVFRQSFKRPQCFKNIRMASPITASHSITPNPCIT
jgi:hypothetical protein